MKKRTMKKRFKETLRILQDTRAVNNYLQRTVSALVGVRELRDTLDRKELVIKKLTDMLKPYLSDQKILEVTSGLETIKFPESHKAAVAGTLEEKQ